jgi:hypothetical protein
MSDKFKYDPKTGESRLNYERKRDGRTVEIVTPGRKAGGGSWFDWLFKKGKK